MGLFNKTDKIEKNWNRIKEILSDKNTNTDNCISMLYRPRLRGLNINLGTGGVEWEFTTEEQQEFSMRYGIEFANFMREKLLENKISRAALQMNIARHLGHQKLPLELLENETFQNSYTNLLNSCLDHLIKHAKAADFSRVGLHYQSFFSQLSDNDIQPSKTMLDCTISHLISSYSDTYNALPHSNYAQIINAFKSFINHHADQLTQENISDLFKFALDKNIYDLCPVLASNNSDIINDQITTMLANDDENCLSEIDKAKIAISCQTNFNLTVTGIDISHRAVIDLPQKELSALCIRFANAASGSPSCVLAHRELTAEHNSIAEPFKYVACEDYSKALIELYGDNGATLATMIEKDGPLFRTAKPIL